MASVVNGSGGCAVAAWRSLRRFLSRAAPGAVVSLALLAGCGGLSLGGSLPAPDSLVAVETPQEVDPGLRERLRDGSASPEDRERIRDWLQQDEVRLHRILQERDVGFVMMNSMGPGVLQLLLNRAAGARPHRYRLSGRLLEFRREMSEKPWLRDYIIPGVPADGMIRTWSYARRGGVLGRVPDLPVTESERRAIETGRALRREFRDWSLKRRLPDCQESRDGDHPANAGIWLRVLAGEENAEAVLEGLGFSLGSDRTCDPPSLWLARP